MVSVTDLRSGAIFQDEGNIFQVLSYEHIKMGRGSATIKVRVRNVRSGATTEKSFINGAKVKEMHLAKRDLQFLYKDGDNACFMDPASFEQIALELGKFPEHAYLKEGQNFSISFLGDEALSLNLPPKMDLRVAETGPSVRGNSATNIYKEAILENGIKTKVPLFISEGDSVRIDTRTGAYTEKA
ncbi:MAG: elongation factor P [bacterium]|nr:elongation factor P [bacterium]